MKKLIIAEKPSVGRDIAKTLNCTKKGDGYLYGDDYVISWAIGHLVTLCDPEEYDPSLKKWNISTLPLIPDSIKLKAVPSTKKQLDILAKLMNDKDIDGLICATDSGREGELIFRYIYIFTKCKKPFLRLWISSMTDAAIKEGFNNLKDGAEFDNLFKSARCRSEADWLVGINATRAFTVKYDVLLSIGRVQTPTLALIVKKQKEIDAFVPDDYWEVEADFSEYKGLWFNPENNETKIPDKDTAAAIVNKVKGRTGSVLKIENEEKKQPPPLLYDLTELQRDCNKRYSYSAQKTLSIAQDLYEKRKLITYPRTDSRYLPDDYKKKAADALKKLSQTDYAHYTEYILGLASLPFNKRIIDNSKITDHHAIVPTDININLKQLGDDEFKVYDLIARRFLSVFYPYYVYNITKITTVINEENFLTKGTTITALGWMELYKDPEKDKKEDLLPDVKRDDPVSVKHVKSTMKKTKPPSAYTEATLLSAMENAGRFVEDEALKEQLKESGLGTPATRAAIIERLIQVSYIVRKGKSLAPTEKGIKLIEVVPDELKSPETTGKWEKGLSQVSKGAMDDKRFMGSINRYVHYIVAQSIKINTEVSFEQEDYKGKNKAPSFGKCPLCEGGRIHKNTKAYFCSNWKRGCKFTVWKNSLEKYGNEVTDEMMKTLLNKKEAVITLPQDMGAVTAAVRLNPGGNGLEVTNALENPLLSTGV